MNREILFRGKRVDNGKWVEGFYLGSTCKDYIVPFTDYADKEKVEVVSDTLGQYTGGDDSKGVRIFEGDIVRFEYYEEATNSTEHLDEEICWYGGEYRFAGRGFESEDYSDGMSEGEGWTVAGNIHDNPELISVVS